ncbi:MAG TPA: hypothetical protein VEK38_03400 [Candidatus Bathyarchaeia archaeon]|nr:hypothetical protein [Candidatus Bathyarchaeia archaeon]
MKKQLFLILAAINTVTLFSSAPNPSASSLGIPGTKRQQEQEAAEMQKIATTLSLRNLYLKTEKQRLEILLMHGTACNNNPNCTPEMHAKCQQYMQEYFEALDIIKENEEQMLAQQASNF